MRTSPERAVLYRTRQANLRLVIDERFGGVVAAMARGLGFGHTYAHQIATGLRNIGDWQARRIENDLELVPGSLDSKVEGIENGRAKPRLLRWARAQERQKVLARLGIDWATLLAIGQGQVVPAAELALKVHAASHGRVSAKYLRPDLPWPGSSQSSRVQAPQQPA